ncbi:MAG: hydroxyisourate hydrolase [Burkholderiales bacterium]|nr:hydroxyisourate hydrolase [Opitutaceae bacterium]
MPAKLSTHVLDTMHGRPAAGVALSLYRLDAAPDAWCLLVQTTTNADGRTDAPLLVADALLAGVYEIRFQIGAYFAALGVTSPTPDAPAFLDEVPIRFGISDPTAAYHVPLLATPWSYGTYRGS